MNPFRRKNGQTVISQSVVLDTSGLIDGRIVQIAKAGFVPQNIVVPQFVIAELQFLADHGDSHKRERARYGLDVIRELQDIKRVDVEIARQKFDSIREVDDKLVALAKQIGAMLYTTDFNLNKVAQIEGVIVLNVNELAQALRPNLLPGERVTIKLTQVGQDKSQGVGYLSDGTMVVVEQASRMVGQQVQAICTRILQTQAGKMMFATLAQGSGSPQQQQHGQNKPQQQRYETGMKAYHASSNGNQRPQQRRQDAPQQHEAQAQTQAPAAKPARAQNAQPVAQPEQQNEQRQSRPRRQRAASTHNAATATTEKQAPKKPAATKQSQAQQKPAANKTAKAAAPRARQSRRRVSPEDSLIATLNEIQK